MYDKVEGEGNLVDNGWNDVRKTARSPRGVALRCARNLACGKWSYPSFRSLGGVYRPQELVDQVPKNPFGSLVGLKERMGGTF